MMASAEEPILNGVVIVTLFPASWLAPAPEIPVVARGRGPMIERRVE